MNAVSVHYGISSLPICTPLMEDTVTVKTSANVNVHSLKRRRAEERRGEEGEGEERRGEERIEEGRGGEEIREGRRGEWGGEERLMEVYF